MYIGHLFPFISSVRSCMEAEKDHMETGRNDVTGFVARANLGPGWQKTGMPVSCCAVDCADRYSGLGFFCFLVDLQCRETLVKAVSRAKWRPSTHDRLCGDHFIGKKPSDDPNDVDYVPTIFADSKGQRSTPTKWGGEGSLRAYDTFYEYW